MYACMTLVGFDTSDKFENHCFSVCDMARMQFIFHSGSLREKYFRS